MESILIYLTHVTLCVSGLVLLAALTARVRIGVGIYVTIAVLVLLVIYLPTASIVFFLNAESIDAIALLTGITTLSAIWVFSSLGIGMWGLRHIPVENRRHAARWSLVPRIVLVLIAKLTF